MGYSQKQLEALYREIEQTYMPNKGWCDIESCTACGRAELQVEAAKAAARRGFYLKTRGAKLDQSAQRRIFDDGYERGRGIALQEAQQWAAQSAHRAATAAKTEWYQRGIREGRAQTSIAAPATEAKAIRAKVLDDVLQECKVIGDSAPPMNPAMNALRHRIKKLR